MTTKIMKWIEKNILGLPYEEPNKYHPSIKCNCRDCSSITDLQGR